MSCSSIVNKNDTDSNIKQGTTLMTAEPFTFSLMSAHMEEHCDHCFKSCKLLRCSGCQFVYYCSRNCQKLSWGIHKIECPNIKKVYPKIIPDAARMMAKIIIKLRNGGGDERGYYTATEYRKFDDLMSHVEEIQKDLKRMEHFMTLCEILREFLPDDITLHPKELLGIFGRMAVNSFHILDGEMTSIGVGIYLGPSIIDHSCKPNAVAVFDGTTIMIKSLYDMPTLDFSKIRVTYIDILRDTKARRTELQKSYYFYCECELCSDLSEIMGISAACPNKKCTNPCLPTDSFCKKCGREFPDDFEDRFDAVCRSSNHNLAAMSQIAYLDLCKQNLLLQEGLLHPFNYLVVRMLESALAAAIDSDHWEDGEIYASQLIPRYIYYHGEIHPVTGQMYFSWAKILSLLDKTDKALEIATKAAKIMKITLGENHVKMRDDVKPLLDQLIAKCHIQNTGH